MAEENSWHLSKSVPITLIFAIILQTASLVWFVSTLRNDVDTAQRTLIRHDTQIEHLDRAVQDQRITIVRMDENVKSIRELLERYIQGTQQ